METNDTNVTVNTEETQDVQTTEQQNTAPSTEELLARIAEVEARAAKAEAERDAANRAKDKANKEAAERKRESYASMTAEQQAKAELEERVKAAEERAAAAEAKVNHSEAVSAYKSIPDEKTVENLIEAVSNADHASIAAIMEAEKQRAVKAAQAEWMKSRPPVNAGDAYSSMTKEQIMDIQDSAERIKAIALHPELFPELRKD